MLFFSRLRDENPVHIAIYCTVVLLATLASRRTVCHLMWNVMSAEIGEELELVQAAFRLLNVNVLGAVAIRPQTQVRSVPCTYIIWVEVHASSRQLPFVVRIEGNHVADPAWKESNSVCKNADNWLKCATRMKQ